MTKKGKKIENILDVRSEILIKKSRKFHKMIKKECKSYDVIIIQCLMHLIWPRIQISYVMTNNGKFYVIIVLHLFLAKESLLPTSGSRRMAVTLATRSITYNSARAPSSVDTRGKVSLRLRQMHIRGNLLTEPLHEKIYFLHMQKQRPRSAAQSPGC